MDQPQQVKPISDDQELAKALAGITNNNDLALEETPLPTPTTPLPSAVDPNAHANPELTNPVNSIDQTEPMIPEPVIPEPEIYPSMPTTDTLSDKSESLEDIKKAALLELRPLVEKLNISAEEKFDIYLLLLRSTDDTTLIAPAHDAAKLIEDETKRAQALLDIIKEIDYLSPDTQTVSSI